MLSRAYTPSSGINSYYPLRFCNGRRYFDTGCGSRFTISFRYQEPRLTPIPEWEMFLSRSTNVSVQMEVIQ